LRDTQHRPDRGSHRGREQILQKRRRLLDLTGGWSRDDRYQRAWEHPQQPGQPSADRRRFRPGSRCQTLQTLADGTFLREPDQHSFKHDPKRDRQTGAHDRFLPTVHARKPGRHSPTDHERRPEPEAFGPAVGDHPAAIEPPRLLW
jgi:hypothetical protein